MARYRLDLSYDGAPFAGFARQPGQRTVQGDVEAALTMLLGEKTEVAGAGRTDAGVHALRQVVAFDVGGSCRSGPRLDTAATLASLAGLLAPHIAPLELVQVDDSFDPRRDARARDYLYMVALRPAPLLAHVSWVRRGALDPGAMAEAAASLVGAHDFSSFTSAEAPRPRVRELLALDVGERALLGTPLLVVRALGRTFLQGMVRTIVGTLVEVGRGRRGPDWVAEVLAARDRCQAGPSAPPHGLVLAAVHYSEDEVRRALTTEPFALLTAVAASLDSLEGSEYS